MSKIEVDKVISGDLRSISRMITILENRRFEADQYYKEIFPHTGKAQVIGITGPPGSGKSTFVDKITLGFRREGKKVGIIAVDPTSPFTGGSILGDRMRMSNHFCDDGVFIRSMGTRGQLGGISATTTAAVDVLDAAGYDVIIVETVGVGQSEVEIASIADLVILVFVPGLGDDIQAIKAGIMEIGDVFVVNKCDLPGADRTRAELLQTLAMSAEEKDNPKVYMTDSNLGFGIDEVIFECKAFFENGNNSGKVEKKRSDRVRKEILSYVNLFIKEDIDKSEHASIIVDKVRNREMDPYTAGKEIINIVLRKG